MLYLLYPTDEGGYFIFKLPPGQTAAETAESFGLTMAVCAQFDMSTFDAGSENFPNSFELIDNQPAPNGASFSLESCKESASVLVRGKYSSFQQTALNGYTPQAISAQAALPEVDRIPAIQSVIEQVNVLSEQLQTNLAAIAAATNATEVNNATFPPTGILSTGRGDSGQIGPLDLNPSFYEEFNSTTIAQEETELYVPGTDTVIPYNPEGPFQFDSVGNCFAPGNFLIQIRVAATSVVLAEFQVPFTPDGNQSVSF